MGRQPLLSSSFFSIASFLKAQGNFAVSSGFRAFLRSFRSCALVQSGNSRNSKEKLSRWVAKQKALQNCMDLQAKQGKQHNTINYHLQRISRMMKGQ
ncbi:hypothetical protein R1flu_006604 [Riccia fluitans]|uniref:Uncharacterized protein n=1 Tax=Riccia fluitans TaxID=41844 RepID=A0ABD1YXC1_9MARC